MTPKSKGDGLDKITRAEDILLGSLGFGPEAKIVTVEKVFDGYSGVGIWPDGEEFQFSSEEDLDQLQCWALDVLSARVAEG